MNHFSIENGIGNKNAAKAEFFFSQPILQIKTRRRPAADVE
jgi:hypothetical protein